VGHGCRVRAVWLRRFDADLAVDVARIVGYRAEADDGWRGQVRKSWRTAADDALARRRGEGVRPAR
jgi:hypothetical protein